MAEDFVLCSFYRPMFNAKSGPQKIINSKQLTRGNKKQKNIESQYTENRNHLALEHSFWKVQRHCHRCRGLILDLHVSISDGFVKT